MLDNLEALSDNEIQEVSGGTTYSGKCFVYTIKKGDCLSVIAKNYGTTVATLVEINGITNPDKIYAGNKILIPCK